MSNCVATHVDYVATQLLVKVEDQSIDYVATHVGKKYPSP
jgi:hypothetical protein